MVVVEVCVVGRLLVPSSALLWGLQFAFFSPALALILVSRYGASTAEVGAVLAIFNASGFVASLVIPAWADRRRNYLGPMLLCGVLTVAMAVTLALVTSLTWATAALVVLGAPGGVGISMLFAQLRHSGAPASTVVNTRAMVSAAWVAGPPLATAIVGWFDEGALLVAIAVVALLTIVSTLLMRRRSGRLVGADPAPAAQAPAVSFGRRGVVLITAAFVLLQAANATGMTILTVYVVETMGLPVLWGGIALGVAAALEVPALLVIGRLTGRFSSVLLILTGCAAGVLFFIGLAAASGPVALLALQPLNAWCFAAISGVGLTLFQDLIAGPGLATGIYTNTRRIGAIVSGPVIALGSWSVLGQRGIFVACAAITLLGLLVILLARHSRSTAVAT